MLEDIQQTNSSLALILHSMDDFSVGRPLLVVLAPRHYAPGATQQRFTMVCKHTGRGAEKLQLLFLFSCKVCEWRASFVWFNAFNKNYFLCNLYKLFCGMQ